MSRPFPANLAGLLTTGGKYTAQQWLEKCKQNPAHFPEYFQEKAGLVYCTPAYRAAYEQYIAQVHNNFVTLGVKS